MTIFVFGNLCGKYCIFKCMKKTLFDAEKCNFNWASRSEYSKIGQAIKNINILTFSVNLTNEILCRSAPKFLKYFFQNLTTKIFFAYFGGEKVHWKEKTASHLQRNPSVKRLIETKGKGIWWP